MTDLVDIQKIIVGGLPIGRLTRKEWADCMVDYCLKTRCNKLRKPVVIFSVNGQVLYKCFKDKGYSNLVNQADGLDADGQPLIIGSRLLSKTPLPERVATTDFFHDAARASEKAGLNFYLLGSTDNNIKIAVKKIKNIYPNLNVVGYRNGYFSKNEEFKITNEIVKRNTDVLWVGLGVPNQEAYVIRNRQKLRGVGWIKTCGGLFDYFNPRVKRAPIPIQKLGLEWLFRTVQEPKKYLKRYITTNGLAACLILTRTPRK